MSTIQNTTTVTQSNTAAVSSTVTWAIEFEVAAASLLTKNDPVPAEDPRRPISGIRGQEIEFMDAIRGTPIQKRFDLPDYNGLPTGSGWEGLGDRHRHRDHEKVDPKYTTWVATTDASVRGVDPESCYAWHGWEFNSRVFSGQPQRQGPGDEDAAPEEEIEAFCRVLRNNIRVQTNDSCGLHVHVGLGESGIPLGTQLKLLTFLCLGGEEALYQMCDKLRKGNYYSKSVAKSAGSWLDRVVFGDDWREAEKRRKEFSEEERIGMVGEYLPLELLEETCPTMKRKLMGEWIWNVNRLDEVPTTTSPGRPCVRLNTYHKTVEFRIKEGMLDPKHIVDWVRVVLGIFQFVHFSTPHEFRAAVESMVRKDRDEGEYLRGFEDRGFKWERTEPVWYDGRSLAGAHAFAKGNSGWGRVITSDGTVIEGWGYGNEECPYDYGDGPDHVVEEFVREAALTGTNNEEDEFFVENDEASSEANTESDSRPSNEPWGSWDNVDPSWGSDETPSVKDDNATPPSQQEEEEEGLDQHLPGWWGQDQLKPQWLRVVPEPGQPSTMKPVPVPSDKLPEDAYQEGYDERAAVVASFYNRSLCWQWPLAEERRRLGFGWRGVLEEIVLGREGGDQEFVERWEERVVEYGARTDKRQKWWGEFGGGVFESVLPEPEPVGDDHKEERDEVVEEEEAGAEPRISTSTTMTAGGFWDKLKAAAARKLEQAKSFLQNELEASRWSNDDSRRELEFALDLG
ncbi:hypothetical protein MKZ38_003016 [Zalerion maritima]|uniref:Amidoligase enzyme protein n=1 Tax=Zalerion maritima TaxID=339359 RepID=A0AAD5RP97_9PEZI|nr:hypothetical protein MKZ38_003016 [Zalerion maritima]